MKIWQFGQMIINWQHKFGRHHLPWQKNNDPYYIWVSEIMLQQTQVKTVIPYFQKFINIFQNIESLAQTNLNNILHLWSGLGYYNRACNMHKTAKIIYYQYNNQFPNNFNHLIQLPGIGKTTAHAILSFAYNYAFPILDSNVKRILTRFYNLNVHNANKYTQEKKLWRIINIMCPLHHTNKFNQGMMDLGAMICSHSKPKCNICPIESFCQYDINTQNIKYIAQSKKNKKKCFFYIILQYKKYIFLNHRTKKNFWKQLFCFPEFHNLIDINNWFYTNQIHNIKYKKYYNIKHKFSNFTLYMICINVILSKKIFINTEYNFWYHKENKKKIGIPKPICDILLNI